MWYNAISEDSDMNNVKKLEKIFKALGDKTRLRIINMLIQKPMCVCEITSILPFSQSTISGHLKVLRDAEVVVDTKNGLWVVYHLNTEHSLIEEIFKVLDQSFGKDEMFINERKKSFNADRYKLCKK